jgi:hypothetical protein
MVTEFEILDGMPVYGPYPEQFSATSWGTHSQGFVLRVRPPESEAWVGNFQRGLSSYDAAHLHPNSRDLIVVAGGQAYIVEPKSRHLIGTFGAQISWSQPFVEHQLLLFHNGLWLDAYGFAGQLWQTRRLSWDGVRVQSIEWPWLNGEAWTFDGDRWVSFALDLRSGDASGGSYVGPE